MGRWLPFATKFLDRSVWAFGRVTLLPGQAIGEPRNAARGLIEDARAETGFLLPKANAFSSGRTQSATHLSNSTAKLT